MNYASKSALQNTAKWLSVPVLTMAIPALVWVMGVTAKDLSSEMRKANFSRAVQDGNLPFDLEPDGSAVYRFGMDGRDTVTCVGTSVRDWDIPFAPNRSDLKLVCEDIAEQRSSS